MAALVVTFLPVVIIENGNFLDVEGEVRFDGGNYATGGVQGAWDYTTTPNTGLIGFKQVEQVHASQAPIGMSMQSGDAAGAIFPVAVAGSPLPKVIVEVTSTGAESTNGAAIAAGMQGTTPVAPHTFAFRYRKNL